MEKWKLYAIISMLFAGASLCNSKGFSIGSIYSCSNSNINLEVIHH